MSSAPEDLNADTTEHLAYAEASLMLVEGIMLVLLEKQILTLEDLQSVIENAVETKQAFVDADVHPRISNVAAGVLRRLANSVAASRVRRDG
jgi:hypothetical protein